MLQLYCTSKREDWITGGTQQVIAFRSLVTEENKGEALQELVRLRELLEVLPGVAFVHFVNLSNTGHSAVISRGLPGKYGFWVYAKAGADVLAGVMAIVSPISVTA